MKTHRRLLLLVFVSVSCILYAGEYGLSISDKAKVPCDMELRNDLNKCTSKAVSEDLIKFFTSDDEFSIAAVKMGYLTNRIWFDKNNERKVFYGTLVSLLKSNNLKKDKELIKFMKKLPYKSMCMELEKELSNNKNDEVAKQRLHIAYINIADKCNDKSIN